MNSWSESIPLPKPLRDALPQFVRAGGAGGRSGDAMAEEERRKAELKAQYQLGLADGEKALTEKLYRQRAEIHELTHGFLESLRKAVPQVVRDTENSLVSLALTVAQKLVAGMPVSAEMVEAAVRDALAQLEGTARFTVRLHRDDLDLLEKAGSPLLKAGENSAEFRFIASAEVPRGGCIIETDFGTIDARRETKFELLKRSLAA
jgi:flagellar biosynthesis/type III secretory pathway protein FliH